MANTVRYADAFKMLEHFYECIVERRNRGGSLNTTENELLGYYKSINIIFEFLDRICLRNRKCSLILNQTLNLNLGTF